MPGDRRCVVLTWHPAHRDAWKSQVLRCLSWSERERITDGAPRPQGEGAGGGHSAGADVRGGVCLFVFENETLGERVKKYIWSLASHLFPITPRPGEGAKIYLEGSKVSW